MSVARTTLRSVALLLVGLVALSASASAQTRLATNLDAHSSVTINRPAAVIWPYVVDPSAWKRGSALRHVGGTPGEVGEVFAASNPTDMSQIAFYAENVELVQNRRRTIKLYLPSGSLIGFATWTLRERGGHTVVEYDVYSETLIDASRAQSMTGAQPKETERTALATNQKRFDEELLLLKQLVEKGASR